MFFGVRKRDWVGWGLVERIQRGCILVLRSLLHLALRFLLSEWTNIAFLEICTSVLQITILPPAVHTLQTFNDALVQTPFSKNDSYPRPLAARGRVCWGSQDYVPVHP